MTIDIARARSESPATSNVLHFNNAGAALMPTCVLNAQIEHLQLEARIGGYEAAARENDRIEAVYGSVARLVGASADEIALVENATVAWDMAFYALEFEPGDRILTAEAEYAANFVAFLQVAKRTGAVVDVIPSNDAGEICCSSLESMIDDQVKLIAITHVPTNGGLVNPAKEVGAIARAHGITYLLDACQAVGQMPIDVNAIGCDMLSATGRKYLRGPRGSGFLYVRRDLAEALEPPMVDHAAANWVAPDRYELIPGTRRFENWENNYAAQLGLGTAIDYALDWGLDAIWQRVQDLATMLRTGLGDLDGVSVMDIGRVKCGIVTFIVDDLDPAAVKSALAGRSMNVSVSHPSSTLLDARARDLPQLLRASVHYYNDEEEIIRFIAAIADLAKR